MSTPHVISVILVGPVKSLKTLQGIIHYNLKQSCSHSSLMSLYFYNSILYFVLCLFYLNRADWPPCLVVCCSCTYVSNRPAHCMGFSIQNVSNSWSKHSFFRNCTDGPWEKILCLSFLIDTPLSHQVIISTIEGHLIVVDDETVKNMVVGVDVPCFFCKNKSVFYLICTMTLNIPPLRQGIILYYPPPPPTYYYKDTAVGPPRRPVAHQSVPALPPPPALSQRPACCWFYLWCRRNRSDLSCHVIAIPNPLPEARADNEQSSK